MLVSWGDDFSVKKSIYGFVYSSASFTKGNPLVNAAKLEYDPDDLVRDEVHPVYRFHLWKGFTDFNCFHNRDKVK